MGARFVAASSQSLLNSSARVTNFPFVLACWVYIIDTAAAYTSSGLANQSATTDFWNMGVSTAPALNFNVNQAGSSTSLTSLITPVAGNWYYTIGRCVSATSRWIIVYDPSTGRVDQAQSTISRAPTLTVPRLSIGVLGSSTLTNFSNNIVAEWFCMDTDVLGYDTNATLAPEWVRALALEGPFSRREISDDIVEYKALRQGTDNGFMPIRMDTVGESYSRVGFPAWTSGGLTAPAVAPHPPLSPNYVRPNQYYNRNTKIFTVSQPSITSPFMVFQRQTLSIPLQTAGTINLGVHS